ncbi:MAG: DUF928 domain-containing protein [Myxococcota bacterium]
MNGIAKRSWVMAFLASCMLVGASVASADPGADAAAVAKAAANAGSKAPAGVERAAKEGAAEGARAAVPAELPAPIVYVPPPRGRARHTAGAGTRGISGSAVRVAVVAPNDHVALTTRSQPTLYWFVSEDTETRIDLTLTDEEAIDPLLELTVPGPVEKGIHALRLSDLGLELDAEKTYRWNVALVADAKRRSNDTFAQGFIARTPVTNILARSLKDTQETFAPYALSGIWYDAMDELFGAIEKKPSSRRLRRQQIALLEQANLGEVAAFAVRDDR